MVKLTKIDLAEKLSQGYYAGKSTIILNFPHCFVVRTEVTDTLNKIEFAIFYLVSESLSAVEFARGNSNSGIIWSIPQNELRRIFELTADDIYLIECEVNYYHESGELLMEEIINLGENLSRGYVNNISEVIQNFRDCFLVCTEVWEASFEADKLNGKDHSSQNRFAIYYLVSEYLFAREIARSYGNKNYKWSVDKMEIKKLYNLSDEDIEEIEFEMILYRNNKNYFLNLLE